MACHEPRGTAARRIRSTVLAAFVFVGATVIGVVTGQLVGPSLASSPSAASPSDRPRGAHRPGRGQRGQDHQHRNPTATTSRPTARGEAGGVARRGLTVFDNERPAVANLDSDLLGALRQAATDAASDGVEIFINSGWRSPEYQERLLRQAVSKYGSEKTAARWVATADTSSHVSGHAVDIGPSRATAWLSRHGAKYRLCQIYRNEPWHYELRSEAVDDGCPSMYADPRHDPRMQQ
jgi:D-alanyl-D-alanine carboxypeptidase